MKDLLQKKSGVVISRIDHLLQAGVDRDVLIEYFKEINKRVWGNIVSTEGYVWTEEMLQSQFNVCPNTIYCAFNDGKMVATLTYIRVDEEDLRAKKTWLEKTDNGLLTTHKPNGKFIFGVDLSVLKEAPRSTSRKLLSTAIFIGIIAGGVKAAYLGSRIPSFNKYREMEVEKYVFNKRENGKPLDPELAFYAKNGFKIVEIIPDYMDDPQSLNFGVLVKWSNALYPITKVFPPLKKVLEIIGRRLLLG